MDVMNKRVLKLALPSILANLTVPLVGMVDIAVAGHLDASAAALIGGVSVGSLMFDLLYWNFGFLRAGTGGMTAQAFGRSDWDECVGNLLRGVGLALVISLVLILLQWPFQKLIFLFVGCSDEVHTLALDYFYIRIWAAPATLSLMAFRGWFIGMQDTVSSMLTDVLVNGGNIIFSVLLTFGIARAGLGGLGFDGIAAGTVVAQYSGLIFASAVALRKLRKFPRRAVPVVSSDARGFSGSSQPVVKTLDSSEAPSLSDAASFSRCDSGIPETDLGVGTSLDSSVADLSSEGTPSYSSVDEPHFEHCVGSAKVDSEVEPGLSPVGDSYFEHCVDSAKVDSEVEPGFSPVGDPSNKRLKDEYVLGSKFKVMPWCGGLSLGEVFAKDKVRRFFSVNRDLFIRSVCLIIVYLAFMAISAGLGNTLLASCSIMLKLLLLFSYFTDGFAFAGESLTGRFVGMRWPSMVRLTVDYTFAWSMGIAVIFVFIYAFFGDSLLRLLTSDPAVVSAAHQFMPWLFLFPLVSCPAFTWDGIYTGATATKPMRDSNIGCVAAFFAVWLLGKLLLSSLGTPIAQIPSVTTTASSVSSLLSSSSLTPTASAHLLFAAYYAHVIYRSLYQTFLYRKSILAPLR